MDDHRARLINETKELKERLIKLRAFNRSKDFRNISKKNQELLLEQEKTMERYHIILETRLAGS